MNNITFNNHPEELKTSVFGVNGTEQKQIKVDTDGALYLNTADPIAVTVGNENPLSVTGTVDINGDVTVTGTVGIDDTTAINVDVTNTSIAVNNTFTSSAITATELGTTTAVLFTAQDISTVKVGTFFLYKTAGTGTVTATLEISPADGATYVADTVVSPITITDDEGKAIHISTFGKSAQLLCSASASVSVIAYFNGQL